MDSTTLFLMGVVALLGGVILGMIIVLSLIGSGRSDRHYH